MIKHLTGDPATEALLGSLHPFKGLGEPEDIAKAAVFLASGDASWVTGVALPVDGTSFPMVSLGNPRGSKLTCS